MRRRELLTGMAAACLAACRSGHEHPAPNSSGAREDSPSGTRSAAPPSSPVPQPTAPLSIPLSTLPDGHRIVVRLGTTPVEIRRVGRVVEARSLLCTHMGCTVRWRDADSRYVCPCHNGLFDAEGRSLEGPPPRDLDRVPSVIAGDTVTVGSSSVNR